MIDRKKNIKLFSKRAKRNWYSCISGFLLALIILESLSFISPELFPSFVTPPPAEAATGIIDPNGNGTTMQGARTTCATANNYDCVDDAVRSPTAPGTGDYVQFTRNQQDNYLMTTLTGVSSVSSITVYIYHIEGNTGHQFQIGLYAANETTQYGTTQNVTIRTTAQWDTVTISGLSLTQSQLDDLRIRTTCTRPGTGNTFCRDYAMYAEVTYTPVINVTVSSTGSQQNLDAGTTTAHVGGTFAIVGTNGSRNITSITVTENGNIDGLNELDNILLRYDLDTTNPYTCDDRAYAPTDTQFGSTDTSGFSAANGTSVFTGSVAISPTQTMCVYVILDVAATADQNETIEIEISAPETDVVGSGSPVISPSTAVTLSGTSNILKPNLTQENYHWRNDDGDEAGATSATGGTQNTAYSALPKTVAKRLRFAISNEGNGTSAATQYRLEYASKVTTCAAASGWTDVGAGGGDFDMIASGLTEGGNTTNVAEASGGVGNPNTTFLSTNGGQRETTSQTGNITLTSSEYVEIEYSIEAVSSVTPGNTYCFRVTNAGTALTTYTRYAEATIAADVNVTAFGTQTSQVLIPSTYNNAGGGFAIVDTTAGSNSLTSVTITASGTVDAQADIDNVVMYYDFDTSAPYNCASESFNGTESQYGATSTNGFNAPNGTVTFNGSITISPTQSVCVYLRYDVGSGATNGETFDVLMTSPSSDVVVSGSTVAPNSAVPISGMTTIARAVVTQAHYHWRNNDGDETAATSATGGVQNTAYSETPKETTIRLRFAIGNAGLASSASTAYRLEWAQRTSSCSLATGWTGVSSATDEWQMSPTGNLTEDGDTTNIAEAIGGVGNPETTFLANNDGVNDVVDTSNGVVLPADNYLDLEYSIIASDDAVQGATYCFRVTNAGTPLDDYDVYAEATIKLDTDFKVQRDFETMTGATLTLTAGVDYEAPSSSSTAFIRITNTQLTGAGPNTGAGNSDSDDVTVYITNPENITSSITFQRAPFPAGNTRISWEIVEYTGVPGGENEFIVRRHEPLTYVAGNTTVTSSAIPNIGDDTDMAVFITSQYNPVAGRNDYNQGLSTSAWNSVGNSVTLTRGASGAAVITSYAAIEFTGTNWKIQRSEHTYTAVGTTETQSITPVNSLSRAFIHAQKRTTSNTHADFGHVVWLSGIGQVSYALNSQAVTASGHTSVAWVIENIQTQGLRMNVQRANSSFGTTGTSPQTNNVTVTAVDDLATASLFVTNHSSGTGRTWPEPILGARLISTTQFELWRSDISEPVVYRAEVVEWPTAARKLEQNYYRLYVDNNALLPTDPWPAGGTNLGENTEMTADDVPLALGDNIRIRMTVTVTASAQPANLDSFKLEFAPRVSSCSSVSNWSEVGAPGSTTALWRGVNNTPVDGTALSTEPPTGGDLLISIAQGSLGVAGTYEESNNTALNPYTAFPDDEVEYDWVIEHNGAADKTSYCFRMVEADGTDFEAYNNYPVIRTVGYDPRITNWRWYDDETNATPSSPFDNENIAPTDVANENAIKLRLVLREASGAAGVNAKFAIQYSEYANFSQSVATVTAIADCNETSLWCYYDGNGTNNGVIASTVISDADACPNGCGTYNESTSTVGATFDHAALTSAEFEFTLQHSGARASAVYYFRLYDIVNEEFVILDSGANYPSLVTQGPQLSFSVGGLDAGQTIAGVVLDATTTPTQVQFGSLPIGTSREAAQRFTINTNSTEGYQLLQYVSQQMVNTYGDEIPPFNATNATPAAWATGCTGLMTGCFGYHTTDGSLQGGSTRFAANDLYAAFSTSPEEVMYSSIFANDTYDIVYRLQVSQLQPAGDYETTLVYIAVPSF